MCECNNYNLVIIGYETTPYMSAGLTLLYVQTYNIGVINSSNNFVRFSFVFVKLVDSLFVNL